MTALPSFVELMASLGLDSSPKPSDRPLPHHSRSSSYSSISSVASRSSSTHSQSNLSPYRNGSPAIVISQQHESPSNTPRDWEMERRRSRARYSPYSPPISHTRRGSMPTISGDEENPEHPPRALSSSPCPPLPQRSVGRRSSALGLTTTQSRRPEKLALVDPDLLGNTPISTFVRRRTPQSSPISPTFPHRSKRSSSPSHPVSIPKLPTFVFPSTPMIVGNTSSDTDDEDMNSDSSYPLEPRPKNLSVRKLRSARRSDSNIALRRSQPLENHLHHRITPVA